MKSKLVSRTFPMLGAASLLCMLSVAKGQTFTNSNSATDISYLTVVGGTSSIGDLNLSFTIGFDNHAHGTYQHTLTSPSGTTVILNLADMLHYGTGYNEGGYYVWDDESTNAVPSYTITLLPGTYQPVGLLSDFDGEAADGVWTLDLSGWSNMIESWSLIFTPAEDASGSEVIGNLSSFSLQTLQPFTNTAAGQLRMHAMRGPSKTAVASNDSVMRQEVSLLGMADTAQLANGWEAWAQANGETGDIGTGAAGYNYNIAGATVGADRWINQSTVGGVVVGYSDASMDLDAGGSGMDVDSARVGIQGMKRWENVYLLGTLHYGLNGYEGSRSTMTGTAQSDFDGQEYGFYVEAGLPYLINTPGYAWDGVTIQPMVAFQYTVLNMDGYTETGAGASNLVVGERDAYSERASVGVMISKDIETALGKLSPFIDCRYAHDFEEDSGVVNAAFTGGGAVVSQGTSPGEDFVDLRTGASLAISERTTLYAGFEGRYSTDASANGGYVGARVSF